MSTILNHGCDFTPSLIELIEQVYVELGTSASRGYLHLFRNYLHRALIALQLHQHSLLNLLFPLDSTEFLLGGCQVDIIRPIDFHIRVNVGASTGVQALWHVLSIQVLDIQVVTALKQGSGVP